MSESWWRRHRSPAARRRNSPGRRAALACENFIHLRHCGDICHSGRRAVRRTRTGGGMRAGRPAGGRTVTRHRARSPVPGRPRIAEATHRQSHGSPGPRIEGRPVAGTVRRGSPDPLPAPRPIGPVATGSAPAGPAGLPGGSRAASPGRCGRGTERGPSRRVHRRSAARGPRRPRVRRPRLRHRRPVARTVGTTAGTAAVPPAPPSRPLRGRGRQRSGERRVMSPCRRGDRRALAPEPNDEAPNPGMAKRRRPVPADGGSVPAGRGPRPAEALRCATAHPERSPTGRRPRLRRSR